jgi:phospholipid/cholesterol/gamma-HCH transport system permease protein
MSALASSLPLSARCDAHREADAVILAATGAWVIATARRLDSVLGRLDLAGCRHLTIDCAGLDHLDTAGAWLLLRMKRVAETAGIAAEITGLRPEFEALLATVDKDTPRERPATPRDWPAFFRFLERLGRATSFALWEARELVGFLGMITIEMRTLWQPRKWRVAALVTQVEQTGVDGLPIIGLLSFLIGVVFAFQGADQLRRFGAEIFTVNLLGVSILREIGGLMAAIIVAGRSGSAFTAQIGTMRVNEEIDAMETLGLNSIHVLVLPRLLGLMITLPLLTFFSDLMGMVGGALMSYFALGITFPAFLRQLQGAISFWTFGVGMIKAPVFAFVIALTGCFEGFQVERNASSVGRLTTQSVVVSIFLVIVVDAAFSILFSMLHV